MILILAIVVIMQELDFISKLVFFLFSFWLFYTYTKENEMWMKIIRVKIYFLKLVMASVMHSLQDKSTKIFVLHTCSRKCSEIVTHGFWFWKILTGLDIELDWPVTVLANLQPPFSCAHMVIVSVFQEFFCAHPFWLLTTNIPSNCKHRFVNIMLLTVHRLLYSCLYWNNIYMMRSSTKRGQHATQKGGHCLLNP